jgi:uncharacterized MAPEG superfamily protein
MSLPTELQVLALAGLLQGVQYVLMSVPANIELGVGKTTSPRDPHRLGGPVDSLLSVGTGRLYRAMNNHFEGLILFTLAVVVVVMGDKSSALSATCAWIYFLARVLYVPAYYFGFAPWRSLIWLAGWTATMVMIASALLL